jgi:hypothetical protein
MRHKLNNGGLITPTVCAKIFMCMLPKTPWIELFKRARLPFMLLIFSPLAPKSFCYACFEMLLAEDVEFLVPALFFEVVYWSRGFLNLALLQK